MALPPLLPNNTARYRVSYTSNSVLHSFQIRSLSSPSAIGAHINAFFAALAPQLYETTIGSTEFAAAGSDVYNLVTTGAEGAIHGTGVGPLNVVPLAFNFIGRTSGGRRVRRAIFGSTTVAVNYRAQPGEFSAIDAARAVLVNAGSMIMGIDGITPIWKTYVNLKYFDHWVKEVRN